MQLEPTSPSSAVSGAPDIEAASIAQQVIDMLVEHEVDFDYDGSFTGCSCGWRRDRGNSIEEDHAEHMTQLFVQAGLLSTSNSVQLPEVELLDFAFDRGDGAYTARMLNPDNTTFGYPQALDAAQAQQRMQASLREASMWRALASAIDFSTEAEAEQRRIEDQDPAIRHLQRLLVEAMSVELERLISAQIEERRAELRQQ